MLTYYKNQMDLTEAIIGIIDSYWKLEVNEDYLKENLKKIKENNEELMYKNGEYVTTLRQRLGIRRLGVLDKVLNSVD